MKENPKTLLCYDYGFHKSVHRSRREVCLCIGVLFFLTYTQCTISTFPAVMYMNAISKQSVPAFVPLGNSFEGRKRCNY